MSGLSTAPSVNQAFINIFISHIPLTYFLVSGLSVPLLLLVTAEDGVDEAVSEAGMLTSLVALFLLQKLKSILLIEIMSAVVVIPGG